MRSMRTVHDPETVWSKWQPSSSSPWNVHRAAHLIRRAGFGATGEELQRYAGQGLDQTLDELFSMDGLDAFNRQMRPMERVLTSSRSPRQLASWWLLRMNQTPCQLMEKVTLFWHGHFATGAEKVDNARAMLNQNQLLRQHALGKFEPMVQGISRDVAMLIYLDSEDNRKTRPNENYARELMELFCLGPGNYTERDIKEIARCFTGWQIHRGKFRFNAHQHDDGEKSFLGQRGRLGGEQAVRIVLDQPAAPRFIARKLVRYFIADDLELTDELLEPLSRQLRKTDFDLGAVTRTILGSRMMFSDSAIGHKVRSPVEMAIGLLRTLEARAGMNELSQRLQALGHLPMYPPNVKGWEGGRRWINASTYFGRANLVRDIAAQGAGSFEKGSIAKAVGARKSGNAEQWIQAFLDAQLAVPLPQATMKQLVELGSDSKHSLDDRVVNVITAIGATPEFQLI